MLALIQEPSDLSFVLKDILAYLTELWQKEINPVEAQVRLESLQRRYPELRFELIWDEESYAHTLQYSILLYLPQGGTATISLSPDHPIPWLLRWSRHTKEADIVRVNGRTLKIQNLMDCVNSLPEQAPLLSNLINLGLIQEALNEYRIQPSIRERQQALDRFRRINKLFSAQSMYEWLEKRELTHAKLEALLEFEAAAMALRSLIADDVGIRRYWQQHPGAFDTAHVASLKFKTQEQAGELYAKLRDGSKSFYEAAEFLFSREDRTSEKAGLFTKVRRSSLQPEYAEAIFAAAPGAVIGPLAKDDRFEIVKVIKQQIADLAEPSIYEAVKLAVFDEWLAKRRQQAKIEWFWGRVEDGV